MVTLLQDDFNRANGAVGTSSGGQLWVVENGSPAIASNQLSMPAGAAISYDTGYSDVDMQITLVSGGFINYAYLIPRFVDLNNTVMVQKTRVGYVLAGAFNTVYTYAVPIADGSVIRVVAFGDNIIVYDDGVEIANVTITQFSTATKQAIIHGVNYTGVWDNLTITDVPLPEQPWNFRDGNRWRPQYDGINVGFEEPASGKDKTKINLSSSTYDIHTGSSLTLTATLKSGGTGLSTKTVVFEKNTGSSWSSIGSSSTDGSGIATLGSIAPTAGVKYRARFAGDGSYVSARSSTIDVVVRALREVTKRFYSTWSQTYDPNDTQYTGSHPTDLYQSTEEYSGGTFVMRKRKSLCGFDVDKIQTFLMNYEDAVNFKGSVKTKSFPGAGVLLWGLHDYTNKPTTWDDARVDQNLYSQREVINFSRYNVQDSTTVADWAAGNIKGMAFGPAPSNSQDYGVAMKGAGDVDTSPWVEFTVTKWLPV